jgi:integration host factor subunit alpha
MAPVGLMRELGRIARFTDDDKLTGEQSTVPPSTIPRASLVANDDGGGDAAVVSPTLTKAELAELVFQHVGLNKREAKDMVEAFFAEINDALERGESVKLTGFGNFQLRDKVSRPGRNPKTGVHVNIPARRVVTFHSSQKLKIVADDSAIPGIPEHVDVNDRG